MTRAVHHLGMIAAISLRAGALAMRDWRLFIAHPVHSVANAAPMFALWLTGSLRPELAKAGFPTHGALTRNRDICRDVEGASISPKCSGTIVHMRVLALQRSGLRLTSTRELQPAS